MHGVYTVAIKEVSLEKHVTQHTHTLVHTHITALSVNVNA